MKKITTASILILAALLGCSTSAAPPVEHLEPASAPGVVIKAGQGGGSSSSGAGGEGGGPICDAPSEDVCNYTCGGWPAPHPAGCVCGLECLPASGPCVDVACSGAILPSIGGTCEEHLRAPGLWCLTGVGTCDGHGGCVLPAGTCDPIAPLPSSCSTNADCNDGDPCTKDFCVGFYCLNQPEPDGTPCNAGKTCNAGACCAP